MYVSKVIVSNSLATQVTAERKQRAQVSRMKTIVAATKEQGAKKQL